MNRIVISMAIVLLLSACIPPEPTITVTPPISPPITPTPPTSPPVTPPPRAVETPERTTLVRASTIISNALVNGGFNLPYAGMPGYSTITLPQGWKFGWLNKPCTHNDTGCVPLPCPTNCLMPSGNCTNDYACYFAMPETSRVLWGEYDNLRTREGNASAKAFANRMWAGWYYQIADVGAGNVLTFSVYLQAWMCYDFADCSKGKRSDLPTAMHLKVGIDPYGGKIGRAHV